MFKPERTAVGEMLWRDKDGGSAKLTIRFPFLISLAQAYSSLSTIAAAAQAISDATIVKLTVRYHLFEYPFPTPGEASNIGRYLALYYSNEADTIPIWVPSPRESLLETSGHFAGIRLDLGNPEVASLADAFTNAISGASTEVDTLWGRILRAGGVTR